MHIHLYIYTNIDMAPAYLLYTIQIYLRRYAEMFSYDSNTKKQSSQKKIKKNRFHRG